MSEINVENYLSENSPVVVVQVESEGVAVRRYNIPNHAVNLQAGSTSLVHFSLCDRAHSTRTRVWPVARPLPGEH